MRLSIFVLFVILLAACQSAIDDVPGCSYETALNYNPEATIDDGSCVFEGCIDGTASVPFYGYEYSVVQIGAQCWFSEDLRTEQYQNGDSILHASQSGTWQAPVYIEFGDEDGPNGTTIGCSTTLVLDCDSAADWLNMGNLYNWYAAHDVRNVCPSGWHIPTRLDWLSLFEFMGVSAPTIPGGPNVSGEYLWEDQNIGPRLMLPNGGWPPTAVTGDNSLGFSATISGRLSGDMWGLVYETGWWSSQTNTNSYYDTDDLAEVWSIGPQTDGVIFEIAGKSTIHPCRCIQD